MNIAQNLSALRSHMKANNIHAYIIPSSDPHQSEYAAKHWESRLWISGFDGSAGTVIITHNHAGLWTDSRYFLQAEQQLANSEFELHKMYDQFRSSYVNWLKDNLNAQETVGVDGTLFSVAQVRSLQNQLSKKNIKLNTYLDLVDPIWSDRPQLPKNKAFVHDVKFSGESVQNKIQNIKQELSNHNAHHYLFGALDEIAWILNIRSSDIDYNPVMISHLIISNIGETILFVDQDKISNIAEHLNTNDVQVMDYFDINKYLTSLKSDAIIIDPSICNIELYNCLQDSNVVEQKSIAQKLKAIKNNTEINHIRDVMVKDGVAIANTFFWLENVIDQEEVREYDVLKKLAEYRSQQKDYFGESFGAIIGYKGNGAIIHYKPDSSHSDIIKREGILLCDSGGQYHNGTTDITRTFALSNPTETQKEHYTHVLIGHIELATAYFPANTTGGQLDVLARISLWNHGLNYLHGTGHGVGFFLNVHEPPQGFTAGRSSRSDTTLEIGMYSSNEPGYYLENEYGIRIENLIITTQSEFEGFYKHETVTLYPIDKSLIKKSMLNQKQIDWINDYHKIVWEKLSPHLKDDVKSWFKPQCDAL